MITPLRLKWNSLNGGFDMWEEKQRIINTKYIVETEPIDIEPKKTNIYDDNNSCCNENYQIFVDNLPFSIIQKITMSTGTEYILFTTLPFLINKKQRIMNSQKTKSKNYSLVNGKAIAGLVLIPKDGYFQAYVAWEFEDQAKKKFFSIIESPHLVGNDMLTNQTINWIADYGNDVTYKKDIQKLFPQLF